MQPNFVHNTGLILVARYLNLISNEKITLKFILKIKSVRCSTPSIFGKSDPFSWIQQLIARFLAEIS
jgi:hypothetical protein